MTFVEFLNDHYVSLYILVLLVSFMALVASAYRSTPVDEENK